MKKRTAAISLALTLCLAACGQPAQSPSTPSAASSGTVKIQDNRGEQTIKTPPVSVVALDNRTFQPLQEWGIKLSAAPKSIMPATNPYKKDSSIPDIGNHREPNLETVVAAKPDLVLIGQRFTQHYDAIKKLLPNSTLVEMDPREDKPFSDELKRQVTILGDIFGKQVEAKKLVEAYDAAAARVKAAYDPSQKVMAVNVSSGKIGFIAPGKGRALGPIFTDLGLTPALQVKESSSNHEGDEVSVEAIANAKPDWILVMDRSAAIHASKPDYKPAVEIIQKTEALKNVPAVAKGQVVIMPSDTYLNEGIQTYTEFLNDFANVLEKAKKG